ncbi:MAG: hypothetical protein ABEJ22_03155 [Haloferacaceae archaeon]
MEVVWFLDRAAALVAYPALYLAVITGVFYDTRSFGFLGDAARDVHVEVSAFATLMMLLHGVVGVLDTWLVLAGQVPAPAYSNRYLLAGAVVGAGGLLLLLVAVLGFVDARRFERPWGPRVVHAFAYGGFAFATVHAAAIGTDVVSFVRPGLLAGAAFLVYVLLLRLVGEGRENADAGGVGG